MSGAEPTPSAEMSSHSTLAESTTGEDARNSEAPDPETFKDKKSIQLPLEEGPPDSGYGWVIVACTFLVNAVTWGYNTVFGVFFSFYRKNDFFPGATNTEFAFVGGLSISCCMLVAPLATYLSKRYHFKVPMTIGVIFYVLAQVFAGLSNRIWQLFITQGVMFGIGVGLIFIPCIPLTNQWFTKKRALAGGLAAAGSGGGGLVLSLITRVTIERLGLKWAFLINAFICLAVLVPSVVLLKSRVKHFDARFEPIQYQFLWHPGFAYVWLWAFFSLFGYVLAVYTLATFATSGLGLSQAQGSNLQSIFSAGQFIGRPLAGLLLDRCGRINMASYLSFLAGLSCLVIWMVARSFGVLVFFSIMQGMFGGTVWATCAPVTVEVVGLTHLGSALSILWLTIVIPSTIAEPISVWLLEYSTTHLHRIGADAYLISIGFAGASFIAAALVLLGAKRWKQDNWHIFTKT